MRFVLSSAERREVVGVSWQIMWSTPRRIGDSHLESNDASSTAGKDGSSFMTEGFHNGYDIASLLGWS
jgi:hypothetical protein